ncbi:dinucleotide-utilizing enzyme, molybdopterin/thiamine biosynthesis family 1 [Campylobacter hyointestinalis subsp. lawsonii CCUG 27631]|uniref:ThiF family adenylyltransferase n=1 Tax=Campylobacter hyointestinalis TaxID=198 RepID=UPI0007C8A2B5|nr:ThiF family adenylyltransferase [Campylobacter hyointestinalis]ANE33678.1 dinucleotide-utilizing enzyme, molybdopterin/thiamine biosynthesis family 1 [Campylobacter hyointestinalis subsp. lawsonii CCUG 27631]RAZ49403.1 tRNA threonylcarbamoyladenosine dehydratase [Campylobacter hyointestinalis subsp. lawsonii]RAZ52780.1 tRNA threonylcarbamoyladenosine dehydratase [Campylobacter hyointestinalis subsp. lawsonii]
MVDRFTRSRWIFGDKFEKLQSSKVLVCGCGGVGGVCIDALYRSGVGSITAIDCDKFDITNQNRQIGSENIGEYKTDVFARLYPGLKTLNLKLTPSVISEFDFSEFDLIIDCIDDIPAKVAIAKICSKRLLSSMGGAKRLDPTKIKAASIWKTTNDPFARKIRYELKKAGFKGDYKVVFSTEAPNCVNLGSFIGVTASFGLNLASLAVKKIINA